MATVVIRPDREAGQTLRDLIVELGEAFGPGSVRAAHGGAVVSWAAGRDYLAAKLPAEPLPPAEPVQQQPAGPSGALTTSNPDPAPARAGNAPPEPTPAAGGAAGAGAASSSSTGGEADEAAAGAPPRTRARKTTRSRPATGKTTKEHQ